MPVTDRDHPCGGSRTLSYAEAAGALTDPAAQIRALLDQAHRTNSHG